jgi:ATP-dependent DNA helicase RecG
LRFLKNEILDLIKNGESESIEFKKSTSSLREAIQSICAFANHHGGYVIFGVDDNGRVLGQQVTDDTIKNISNAIKLNTDPKVYPNIEKWIWKGKPFYGFQLTRAL